MERLRLLVIILLLLKGRRIITRSRNGEITFVTTPFACRLHDFNVSTLLFTVVRPCVAMCIAFHIIVEKMPIRHLHYAI